MSGANRKFRRSMSNSEKDKLLFELAERVMQLETLMGNLLGAYEEVLKIVNPLAEQFEKTESGLYRPKVL